MRPTEGSLRMRKSSGQDPIESQPRKRYDQCTLKDRVVIRQDTHLSEISPPKTRHFLAAAEVIANDNEQRESSDSYICCN